jgi:hypothetical protein
MKCLIPQDSIGASRSIYPPHHRVRKPGFVSLNLYYLLKRSSKEIGQDPLTSWLGTQKPVTRQTWLSWESVLVWHPAALSSPSGFCRPTVDRKHLCSLTEVNRPQKTMVPVCLLVYYVSSSETQRGNNAVGRVNHALQ